MFCPVEAVEPPKRKSRGILARCDPRSDDGGRVDGRHGDGCAHSHAIGCRFAIAPGDAHCQCHAPYSDMDGRQNRHIGVLHGVLHGSNATAKVLPIHESMKIFMTKRIFFQYCCITDS